ncbi:MAG: hypothetical protein ABJC13_05840 [Acidobacteriota bacterium]
MSRSKLLPLFLFVVVLALFALPGSAASAPVAPAAAPSVAAPACGIDAGLLFSTGVSAAPKSCGAAPAAQVGVPEPEFLAKRLGYCHCGCSSARCQTSADCGGSSCDPFISCC